MISLVLTVLIAGIALRILLRQHWTAVAAGERGALQSSLRGGALYLVSEFREIGGTPGDPDILAFAPESLTYRAMRGAGFSCRRSTGLVSISLASFTGYRSPQAGRDSLLLHLENGEATSADDQWLRIPVLSVGNGSCAGTPALDIATVLDTASYPTRSFATFAPLRTFEVMQVKLYQSAGEYWLGTRSVSAGETIQPVIGPLSSQGLALAYYDSTGAVATAATDVRSIEITIRGMTSVGVRSGAGFGSVNRQPDSLTTRVLLRNW
ncbi:MAG: hypothetical protein ABI679_03005 [Gemmatimonadota bacterium]